MVSVRFFRPGRTPGQGAWPCLKYLHIHGARTLGQGAWPCLKYPCRRHFGSGMFCVFFYCASHHVHGKLTSDDAYTSPERRFRHAHRPCPKYLHIHGARFHSSSGWAACRWDGWMGGRAGVAGTDSWRAGKRGAAGRDGPSGDGHRRMGAWLDEHMDGWMDEWTDGRTGGRAVGSAGARVESQSQIQSQISHKSVTNPVTNPVTNRH